MNKLFVGTLSLFVVVACFTVADAATPRSRAIPHISPESFENLIVTPAPSCTVDFGVLSNDALGIPCRESSTCAAAKSSTIALGDTCLASTTTVTDGGVDISSTATLSCRAVANGVVFKLCLQVTDGGTLDVNSAVYTGRIVH